MEDYCAEIPSSERTNDLTILYKDDKKCIHEIKTPSDEFIINLRYFQKKINEINHTKLVYIEEDINFELFVKFLDSIKTKKVMLNEDNYSKYLYLSNKYEYLELKKIIEDFMHKRPDIVSIVDQFIKSENLNDSEIQGQINFAKEELIAKNLDICLKNGFLHKIPLVVLNRILNSPKRVINDHHLLFSFVLDKLKEFKRNGCDEDDENIRILPGSLDYCSMTVEEMNELFEVEGEKDDFISPSKARERINIFISNEKRNEELSAKIEENISKCNEQINTKNVQINELNNKLNEFNSKQDKQICDLEAKFSKQIKELEMRFENKIQEINKQHRDELQKLYKIIDELKQSSQESLLKNELRVSTIETNQKNIDTKYEEKLSKLESFSVESTNNQKSIQNEIQKLQSLTLKVTNVLYYNNPENRFKGIISHICKQDPGLVDVTSSSIYNDSECRQPINVINYTNNNLCFNSMDVANSWLCICFKRNLVSVTHYSINANDRCESDHLKNWKIEGSNDKTSWQLLDARQNESSIASRNKSNTFETQYNKENFFRYIRIVQTGLNSSNNNELYFSSIEFFGSILHI